MNHSDDGRPLPVCYAWHPEKPSPILDGHRLWGKASVRAMMHELDCGCGRHLEGKDEQYLIIKVFLHLEAAHPEIEEPTIELTEEMVAVKLTTQVFPAQRANGRSLERGNPR